MPLASITEDNPDVYFIEFNLLNDFFEALSRSSDYYATELSRKTTEQKQFFLVILLVSAAALFMA